MPQIFRVALDTPLRRLFDYLPPAQAAVAPAVGARVRVPFGRQRPIGLVVEIAATSEVAPARLKPILEVLDPVPVLDEALQGLLLRAAEYYHHPLGQVLSSALPRAIRFGAPLNAREERWLLTEAGSAAAAAGEPRRAPKQRALLALLLEQRELSTAALDERLRDWRAPARALAARGWLASTEVELRAAPHAAASVRAAGPHP